MDPPAGWHRSVRRAEAGCIRRVRIDGKAHAPWSTRWTRRRSLGRTVAVSVPTAHKILIGSAIAFFAFFALWELREARASGDGTALIAAVGSAAGAAAFA